jgi:tetratricopeptide (TPR) repeat protein
MEIVARAEASGKTIYEVARDPSLYDLKAYQHAAALAMQQNPANLSSFYEQLSHADSGMRYWAVLGCFHLQGKAGIDLDAIRKRLNDESHHVRIMAAWLLYRAGDKKAAQECWNHLLSSSSPASLEICNIIDWIGDGHAPYDESLAACKFSHGGYVDRMKSYLGADDATPKRGKKKK